MIGSLNGSVRETNRQGECVLLFFLLLKRKKKTDKSTLKKERGFSVPILRIVFHEGGRHSGRKRRPLVTSCLSLEAEMNMVPSFLLFLEARTPAQEMVLPTARVDLPC